MINLKAIRQQKKLTQQQLADEILCARTVIANIETGPSRPSIRTAEALGKALGFNWWKFFEDGDEENGSDTIHGSGGSKTLEN